MLTVKGKDLLTRTIPVYRRTRQEVDTTHSRWRLQQTPQKFENSCARNAKVRLALNNLELFTRVPGFATTLSLPHSAVI
jgi:hypothetical protein